MKCIEESEEESNENIQYEMWRREEMSMKSVEENLAGNHRADENIKRKKYKILSWPSKA